MIDSYFRTSYQTLLVNPLLPKLKRLGISPQLYTLAGLVLGMATLPSLYFGHDLFAFALLLLSGYLDTLDGSLARAMHSTSSKGAVFDIISDRIVEISVILGLFSVDPESRALLSLLMLAGVLLCITTFLVVGIFVDNTSEKGFHYSPGIMERTEAFAFFCTMILFPSTFQVLSALFIFLITLTGVIRVWEFAKN